ncbi:diguanylate cyclase, partial [filamentous cyanobacterium CCP5]
VIDSVQASLEGLMAVLLQGNYQVEVANGPVAAQAIILQNLPDLIVISTLATETDGYDLCRQLRAEASTRDIPKIVVSPEHDSASKVQAFEAGAADYITKPFQAPELLARVQNQINLHNQRRQLSQQNALLMEEVLERVQVERALRDAESKYISIFQNATAGMFKTTGDGRYLSVNPALAQIYGYDSPEEMIASIQDISAQIYVQPKRRDELMVYLKRYDKIEDAESEVYRKDGSKLWVGEDIWTVRDSQGNFLYFEGLVHDVSERRQMETELRQQRQQADRLLGNILPYQIAQRLKMGTRIIAESFDSVSILFADIVDFTSASGEMTPKELVQLLNEMFSRFDQLAESHSLEKIKTIGDAYMVAGGLPSASADHLLAIARMALDMQRSIRQFQRPDGSPYQLRIGINVGSVVAGVIGRRKFAYDLWGTAVNIASRMETTGEAGRIQVTEPVYEALCDHFRLERRGSIIIKGGGQMPTYWLLGK